MAVEIQIYQDRKKEWRWRLLSNKKIMADSAEGYATRQSATRAYRRIWEIFSSDKAARDAGHEMKAEALLGEAGDTFSRHLYHFQKVESGHVAVYRFEIDRGRDVELDDAEVVATMVPISASDQLDIWREFRDSPEGLSIDVQALLGGTSLRLGGTEAIDLLGFIHDNLVELGQIIEPRETDDEQQRRSSGYRRGYFRGFTEGHLKCSELSAVGESEAR